MEITIEELLKGRQTIIKGKEFSETKAYAEPFLERMSKFTDKFIVNVKMPDQMTIQNSAADITYNRVWIQAVMPEEHTIDSHDEVISLLYGLDARKPVAKIYRGMVNQACTNLCVFDPQWINIQEIVPESPIDYRPIINLMEMTSNFTSTIKKMKDTFIDYDRKFNYLGKWVDTALRAEENYGYGKVKLTATTPVSAYKEVFINQESPYYVPEGMDPSLFDVYNSFTQLITNDKKDLMTKFEKTMLINRILEIN